MRQALQREFGLLPEDLVSVSRKARINQYEACSNGDVVLFGSSTNATIGQIEFQFAVNQHTFSIVHVWDIRASARAHWKCLVTDERQLVLT